MTRGMILSSSEVVEYFRKQQVGMSFRVNVASDCGRQQGRILSATPCDVPNRGVGYIDVI